MTRPTWPCCTKALTRKRPMPCGATAKLHSLVRSNSAACLSFMIERVSASVCWPVSGCGETLVTLPSTLIAGGKSAVRNRSEPLRDTISRSRSLTNFDAWSRSMWCSRGARSAREVLGESSPCPRFRRRNDVAAHQVGEVLVERLHADALPVWIAEYICATLFSRIRLRIAARAQHDLVRRDAARRRPWSCSSVCEITPISDSDSIARTISFSAAGNTSMMRSMVLAALEVCSVPNTRWPVSAAVSARRIVSRSRISPTRMQSGSSRSAERSALANDSVCGPTSRWLIRHFFGSCTNSIGSSTVRMWPNSFSLRWLTIAASVVDLPEPVGPVHQHHAARLERELGEDRRAVELLERQDLRRDGPEHGAGAAVLVECVDAKARQALDLEREVALERLFVVLPLRVVHDVVHHVVHLLVLERVDIDAAHVAVHADHRRQAGRQVQVGGLVLDRKRQQLGDVHGVFGSAARPQRTRVGASSRRSDAMIADKLAQVHARIASACAAAGRPVQSVTLLAVSKTFGAEAVRAAARRRAARFGENYVQEALDKIAALADLRARLEWHLIGPLQSNKTRRRRRALRLGAHGRPAEDRRAAERAAAGRPAAAVRSACRSTSAARRARAASRRARCRRSRRRSPRCRGLRLRGLMAIPEPAGDFDGAAPAAPCAARAVRAAARARACALDTVDGHERRPRGGDRRRRDAGARRQRDLRRAAATERLERTAPRAPFATESSRLSDCEPHSMATVSIRPATSACRHPYRPEAEVVATGRERPRQRRSTGRRSGDGAARGSGRCATSRRRSGRSSRCCRNTRSRAPKASRSCAWPKRCCACPIRETAIALTADQLGRADFGPRRRGGGRTASPHLGQCRRAPSRCPSASCPKPRPTGRPVGRLGAQTVVAATVRAMQLLGRQFVLGRDDRRGAAEAAGAARRSQASLQLRHARRRRAH